MKVFDVNVYDALSMERGTNPGGKLTCYIHGESPEFNSGRKYPAMLVLPGGAYAFCSDREAEPIAEAYYAAGYNAFVLRYSVAPAVRYPVELKEAAMAMAYIRRNAKDLGVDSSHVAAIGFSAGGHLCGSLATMFADKPVKDLGLCESEVRPDAAVMSYAVVSPLYTNGGTFKYLLGETGVDPDTVSIDLRVTENTSPMFIWHTSDDGGVDVENCLRLSKALRSKGVPFNLHIFEHGQHGLSLCDRRVYRGAAPEFTSGTEEWFNLSVKWLKDRGFYISDGE